ncbi:MAG: hypothetical protein CMN29_29210 [Sandaracinus sp.]|nr:hypothetical protein [Sandaracinus sp.]
MTHPHTDTDVLEIVLSWDESPLETRLFDGDTPITVGDDDATFPLPAEVSAPFTLATREGGRWVLRAPAGAELRAARDGVPVLDHEGPLALDPGTTVELRVGDFRFFLRPTEKPAETPRAGLGLDRGLLRFVGGTMLVHLILLGLFLLLPPNAAALTRSLDSRRAEYLRVQLDAVAMQAPETTSSSVPDATPGGEGPGGATPSPEAGDGEPGPQPNPGRTQMRRGQRPATAEDVRSLGTLAGLRELARGVETGPSGSPFGEDTDTGRSWLAAAGPVGGDGIFGGLDMDGTGNGTCTGERCGDGTVPLDQLMDRPGGPHGPGTGPAPTLRPRTRPDFTPSVRAGRATTVGGLTRGAIRRTVRRHQPEVRFCYEQALTQRPDLEGRVTVRFVVDPEGTVRTAVAQPTEGMSSRVGDCVGQAVRRWSFPSSPGVTSVTYPFVFQSAH